MRVSIKDILPPQPHHISGYCGYVQGYKYDCGQSFGRLTHTLFEQRKRHDDRSKPVLADLYAREGDWPTADDRAAVQVNRCRRRECKYSADMVPGYGGHVPQYSFLCGKKFTTEATMGLINFEKIKSACLCPTCKETQNYEERQLHDKIENVNGYTHRFVQEKGGLKKIKETYQRQLPMPPSETPYFLENGNPHKMFMTGYTGHVPDLKFVNGLAYGAATNDALRSFTTRRERRKASVGRPVVASDFAARACPELYNNNQRLPYDTGIMKNYAGHIPGIKFNVGQTVSEGSKNTKTVLAGAY